jgi:hypothetical protein
MESRNRKNGGNSGKSSKYPEAPSTPIGYQVNPAFFPILQREGKNTHIPTTRIVHVFPIFLGASTGSCSP